MTLLTLAAAMGLPPSDLEAIEAGEVAIDPADLLRAGDCLDVGVSYFFEGAPDSEPCPDVAAAGQDLARFLAIPESLRLIKAFAGIGCDRRRRSLVESAEFLQHASEPTRLN